MAQLSPNVTGLRFPGGRSETSHGRADVGVRMRHQLALDLFDDTDPILFDTDEPIE